MTFSIVALCKKTSTLGVATATANPYVRERVPHVEKGIGAIATQGFTNVSYGIKGLELLKKGYSPREVLKVLLNEDPLYEYRQVLIIDFHGRIAAFTGKKTLGWKGHLVGNGYVMAGNILVSENVIKEMARTFEKFSEKPLPERLALALEAGAKAGGDKRGIVSAALVTSSLQNANLNFDIRVDFSKDPIRKLREMLRRT